MMVQTMPALQCKLTQGFDRFPHIPPHCLSPCQLCAIVSNVSSALMSLFFFSFMTYPVLVVGKDEFTIIAK